MEGKTYITRTVYKETDAELRVISAITDETSQHIICRLVTKEPERVAVIRQLLF